MAYVERSDEELFAAWEKVYAGYPEFDEPIFAVGGEFCTPRKMLRMAKTDDQSTCYHMLIKVLRNWAKKHDRDPLDILNPSSAS